MLNEPPPQTGVDPQTQPDNTQQQAGHDLSINHSVQPTNFDSPPEVNPPSPFFIDEPPPVEWPSTEDQPAPSPLPMWNTTEHLNLFGSPSNQPAPSPESGPQPAPLDRLVPPDPAIFDDVSAWGVPLGEPAPPENAEPDNSLRDSPQSQSSPSSKLTPQTTSFFGLSVPPDPSYESTMPPTIPSEAVVKTPQHLPVSQAQLALSLPPLPGIDRQQQIELWARLIEADHDQRDVEAHDAITYDQLIDKELGVVDSEDERVALDQQSHVAVYADVWGVAQRLVRTMNKYSIYGL